MNPPKVFFGAVPSSEGVRRTANLKWRTQDLPNVKDMTFVTDHSFVAAEVAPAGSESGTLLLHLDLRAPNLTQKQMVSGVVVGLKGTVEMFALPYVAYILPAQ